MSNDVFYRTRKWRETRAEHLREYPLCAVCRIVGFQVDAVEVDHVIDRKLCVDPYNHSNLRSLCKQHHGQKTILTEGRHRGKKEFVVVGIDGYPISYGVSDGTQD